MPRRTPPAREAELAYRAAARKYHPDVSKESDAEARIAPADDRQVHAHAQQGEEERLGDRRPQLAKQGPGGRMELKSEDPELVSLVNLFFFECTSSGGTWTTEPDFVVPDFSGMQVRPDGGGDDDDDDGEEDEIGRASCRERV